MIAIAYDDGWAPELLSVMQGDQSPDAIRRGFEELAAILDGLVDRPDEVLLVVPLSLAEAVQRRENNPGYHTNRGSGTVAARTMKRSDGKVDVIIETGFLLKADDSGPHFTAAGGPKLNRDALKYMRRTIIHESQHVVMEQRAAGYDQYDVGSNTARFPRWDYLSAAKMCDEHRAEWNAIRQTAVERPSRKDVLDVLAHLGEELAATNARYQQSPLGPDDTWQLMEGVYSACVPFWTSIVYWAAQLREGDQLAEMASDVTALDLWKRYVGPTWKSLGQALAGLPVMDLSTPAVTLQQAADRVAEWVAESLNYIGFRHIDGASGEAFHIEKFEFPSQRS